MSGIPKILQNCCLRADGSCYCYPGCQCPSVTVIATLSASTPALQGIAPIGALTSPQTCYRKWNVSNTGWAWTANPASIAFPSPLPWSEVLRGSGVTNSYPLSIAPVDGTKSDTNPGYAVGSGTTNYNWGFGLLSDIATMNPSFPAYTNGQNVPGLLAESSAILRGAGVTEFNQTVHFDSATQARVTTAAASQVGTDFAAGVVTYAISGGTVTIVLSDADTDAAAIARATPTPTTLVEEGTALAGDIFTVQETRDDTTLQFNYQTGVIAFLVDGLVPGIAMKLTRVWLARTAKGNGTPTSDSGYDAEYGSSWAPYSTDVTTFTPTATDYLVSGTTTDLPGSISAGDVTPTGVMPFVAGMQIKLSAVYIEPA